MIDVQKIRQEFPILSREVNSRQLVYLDNAATTQKPLSVIRTIEEGYTLHNANIHRGVHFLSQEATEAHEAARQTVADFIGAKSSHEIIFTRGTTEAINLVASSFCRSQCKAGDEILVSEMEHHSNIVPWQLQAEIMGIKLRHVPFSDAGEISIEQLDQMITERTRLVSLCHVSNVLGTVNPVKEIIRRAHAKGVPVMIDGAQSVPHMTVNVSDLDADFYAFSGHKIYGPTGIGVLYGKEQWLDRIPPYQGGGEMIKNVSFDLTTYNELPFKFEAGTPDYIGSTALAAALRFVSEIGMDSIEAHEQQLLQLCTERLRAIPGLRIFGEANRKDGLVSFLVGDIHPYDVGTILDKLGIAVRTGHHCAEPIMRRYGIEGTVRASFALYNTPDEIELLAQGIERCRKMFHR